MADKTHHAGPELAALAEEARADLKKGRSAGEESLAAFRRVGERLEKAKAILPRGAFGRWRKAELGICKQWAHRFKRLHEEWPDVEQALAWAAAHPDSVPVRSPHSVDGALALVRVWRKKNASPPADSDGAASSGDALPKPQRMPPQARLKREVAVMQRYIARLQGMLHDAGVEVPPMIVDEVEVARDERAKMDEAEAAQAAATEQPPSRREADVAPTTEGVGASDGKTALKARSRKKQPPAAPHSGSPARRERKAPRAATGSTIGTAEAAQRESRA